MCTFLSQLIAYLLQISLHAELKGLHAVHLAPVQGIMCTACIALLTETP